jgi:transposase InsO family protein
MCTWQECQGKFSSSDNRSKGILDIIHSDVCGQMTVPSLGNFLYYVIFIDDYSRKTWIYFLKAKDEVFNKFQEFKALVENLSGRKIKILRSDNGGEYTSNEFKDFCREAGMFCGYGDSLSCVLPLEKEHSTCLELLL